MAGSQLSIYGRFWVSTKDMATGGAMLKRAVMRAGAQMNGFLSSDERPSACKRWLGCLRGAYK